MSGAARHWLVVALACLCAGPAAAQTPVAAGCEYDYPPFSIVTADKQADGFSVQLLRAALKAVGREVAFKVAPWAELKQDLSDGKLEALPQVARTDEREELFDFTFPYLTMHGTVIIRDGEHGIHGPGDLAGKQVAVLQEDVAHEYLRRANLGAEIVPLPSFAQAMRELSAGKHDAVVIQKLLAFQIMKEAKLENLRAVGPPLDGYSQVLCFGVRKGDKALLGLLNEGLSIVMADGTYRRLHSEWFASLESMGRTRSRIVVGGDRDYPPYEFLDHNGQPAGYNVDLTRAIARQMGLSVDVQLAAGSEVREGLDLRQIDVVHSMHYSAARDERFEFSPAHTLVQQVIAVREGSPQPSDLRELAGKSIIVMAGDLMHELAVQQGYAQQLTLAHSVEEALRLLSTGSHDCALVPKVPALYWIEKRGWRNLVLSGAPVHTAESCFAVPEGREALLAEFSEGLAAIRKTGQYRAIQAKWLGPYEDTQIGFWTIARFSLFAIVPLAILLIGALLWTRSLQFEVRRRTETSAFQAGLLSQVQDAVVATDQSLRITYLNKVAEEMFGWTAQEAIGKDSGELLQTRIENSTVTAASERLMQEGSYQGEVSYAHKDGGRFPADVRSALVKGRDGQTRGSVTSIRDITERKQSEAALLEADRRKNEFLAVLSHELRNPLAPIRNSLVILDRVVPGSAQASRARSVITRQVEQLVRLVDDLLDVTRFSRNKIQLRRQRLELNELVRRTLEDYRAQFEKSEVRLEFIPDAAPVLVNADSNRLAQVVGNLLQNAAKFTPPGGSTEVSVSKASGQAVLRVADSGVGVAPEMLSRLFQPFMQADTTLDRSKGGLGLGLALVKGLVELHGGDVSVRSEGLGHGTEFILRLPLELEQTSDARAG